MTDIKLIVSGSRLWELWIKRWGLSYLIDDDILFDTFANPRVLFRNLRRFRNDIAKIRMVVISHDHWDHTGGLWKLLELRPGLKVFLPSSAESGLKDRVLRMGGQVIDCPVDLKLKEGVYLSGSIRGAYGGTPIIEQAMVLRSDKGLFILSGCAHPGIVAMVEHVKDSFHFPVYGVMGGFHLFEGCTDKAIRNIAVKLKESGVGLVAPTHCSGARAEKIFKEIFGSGYISSREGESISLHD